SWRDRAPIMLRAGKSRYRNGQTTVVPRSIPDKRQKKGRSCLGVDAFHSSLQPPKRYRMQYHIFFIFFVSFLTDYLEIYAHTENHYKRHFFTINFAIKHKYLNGVLYILFAYVENFLSCCIDSKKRTNIYYK